MLQNDSESDGQQLQNTSAEDVSHGSGRSNPYLNEELPGDPAFGGLPKTKQVYPCYPLLTTAEDQPVTRDQPHPQESSDQ